MRCHRPAVLLAVLALAASNASASTWSAEIIRVDDARLTSADGVSLQLQRQARQLDGELRPLVAVDPQRVRDILSEMRSWEGASIPLRIYCLPGIPEGIESSFAVGREVFLAANFARPSDEVLADTIAHEIGHVVQHLSMPGRRGRTWLRYWELRKLDPAVHRDDAPHRNRPSEIFAEDFRVVYGGPRANASGTLENPDLPWTLDVVGLEEFLLGLARPAEFDPGGFTMNYPNPFNPKTTIRAELPEEMLVPGERVQIDVFDLRGRHVFRFPSRELAPVIEASFRGRDSRGRTLASGVYLYSVRVGERSVSGRMTLLE